MRRKTGLLQSKLTFESQSDANQIRDARVTWGYRQVTAPKRWCGIISHLFGAGPVCLLPRRQCHCSGGATEHGLSCIAAVALSSVAVCAASVESIILEGRVGRRLCRSSWCSFPHRLSVLLALWYCRYGPTSLSLGGRTDGWMDA